MKREKKRMCVSWYYKEKKRIIYVTGFNMADKITDRLSDLKSKNIDISLTCLHYGQ